MPEEIVILHNGTEIEMHENIVELHNGTFADRDEENVVEASYYNEGDHLGYFLCEDCLWCESDDSWYADDDETRRYFELARCDENGSFHFESDMQYGWITSSVEGWFYNPEDYVYCDETDTYYYDNSIANDNGVYWCDACNEYREEGCCDESESSTFDYTGGVVKSKWFKETFGMKYTFGVEMETIAGGNPSTRELENYSVKAVADGSITGLEYVTGVLQGDNGIRHLKGICAELSSCLSVNKSCGVHVHIGGAEFNRRFSILAIMLGMQMEEELYSMMPPSRKTQSYCKPIPKEFNKIRLVSKNKYPRLWKDSLKLLHQYIVGNNNGFNSMVNKKSNNPNGHYSSTRYKWLNLNNYSFKNKGDTIEFRQHGGSLDFEKIYNWVIICMCFVRFVENNPRDIYWGAIGKGPIVTIRKIILDALPTEDANKLIAYVDSRIEKFS